MEQTKIIKPQIEYKGIEEFHEYLKEYSRLALGYIMQDKEHFIETSHLLDSVNVTNPTCIFGINAQLFSYIDPQETIADMFTVNLETTLSSNLHSNALQYLESVGIKNLDFQDSTFDSDNSMYIDGTPLVDIRDIHEINDKNNLYKAIIKNKNKTNQVIDDFYSQFGINDFKTKTYELDLSKAKLPHSFD